MNISGLCLILAILFFLNTGVVDAKVPTWEQLFGATNINAATGNGGLTAAFSSTGDLTAFHWPSPSHFEHLMYLTKNNDDARMQPYFGALPSMGAFFGLVVKQKGNTIVTWLRDAPWRARQKYLMPRCDVVVTDFVHEQLGLMVRTTAFAAIKPGKDSDGSGCGRRLRSIDRGR